MIVNLSVRFLFFALVILAGWTQVQAQSVLERFGQRFGPDAEETTASARVPGAATGSRPVNALVSIGSRVRT